MGNATLLTIAATTSTLLTGLTLAAWADGIAPASDGTGTQVIQTGDDFAITGGTPSADVQNLFHSFSDFNLQSGESATFFADPTVQNILSRVTGGNASFIDGLLQVSGTEANLFFINPSGILFGPNTALNLQGSFTATTSDRLEFETGALAAVGTVDYSALTGNPTGFSFTAPPGSIVNTGSLTVPSGESVVLLGGQVLNTGTISAPEGDIIVSAVAGGERVRIEQVGQLLSLEVATLPGPTQGTLLPFSPLSLPELLTGNPDVEASGVTVNADNTVELTGGTAVAASPGDGAIVGTLDVSGAEGGQILLSGETLALPEGLIDISGTISGGDFAVYARTDLTLGISVNAAGAGNVLLDPPTLTIDAAAAGTVVESLSGGGVVDLEASESIIVDATIDSSDQENTAILTLLDENADGSLTIDLNAPILLAPGQTLTGDGSLVTVAPEALLQNGIDAAAPEASVVLDPGTFTTGEAVVLFQDVTLVGAGVDDTTISGGGAARVLQVNPGVTAEVSNLTVTNGAIEGDGGGISNQGALTLFNTVLSDHTAAGGSGGAIDNTGTLTITNSTLSGSTADNSGGGIANSGTLVLTDTTLSNNTADLGGAISNIGTLAISGSTFTGNTAQGDAGADGSTTGAGGGGGGGAGLGGAIFSDGGAIALSSATFTGNQAVGGNGGAGFANAGIFDGEGGAGGGAASGTGGTPGEAGEAGGFGSGGGGGGGSTFGGGVGGDGGFGSGGGGGGGSTAGGNGGTGGLGGFGGGDGAQAQASAASGGGGGAGLGGAIFLEGGSATLTAVTLSGNEATGGSGGTSTFADPGESGQGTGGGLFINAGADATITDSSTISTNSATNSGGGIFNRGALTLTESSLQDNTAANGAGLASDTGSTTTITDSTLSGNAAIASGGGILTSGTLELDRSTLAGNTGTSGGGIAVQVGGAVVTNSTFSLNEATGSGGGIDVAEGSLDIANSTFSGNSAGNSGGGISVAEGSLDAANSTFNGNSAANSGGGLFTGPGSDSTLTSSLVTGNTAATGANLANSGAFTSGGNNLVGSGGNAGTVGITLQQSDLVPTEAVPDILQTALADNGGPTQTLALVEDSPAIDAGSGSGPDQRGEPVVSEARDIGAFESSFVPEEPVDPVDPGDGDDDGNGGDAGMDTSPLPEDFDPDEFDCFDDCDDFEGPPVEDSSFDEPADPDIDLTSPDEPIDPAEPEAGPDFEEGPADPDGDTPSDLEEGPADFSDDNAPDPEAEETPEAEAEDALALNGNGPAEDLPETDVEEISTEDWASEDAAYSEEFAGYFALPVIPEADAQTSQDTLRSLTEAIGRPPALVYAQFTPVITEEIAQKAGAKDDSLAQSRATEVLELVLVTPGGQPKRLVIPGATREQVIATTRRLLREVTDPTRRRRTTYLQSAQQLYQWLVAPLEERLSKEEIAHLSFIMAPGLRSLPLAALHDGEQFIIENYTVGLMPSLALTDTRYRDLRQAPVLAMGASEFESQVDLPAVPFELDTIVGPLREGERTLNEAFTPQSLVALRSTTNYPILHLATHGEFRSGGPENSYIQFWDQRITLDQIQQLQLTNPPLDLLVMSACRTALGDISAELGFAGLAVQTGVRSALASLWQVSDLETAGLMAEFYTQLSQQPYKAEALRQAQLAMLREEVDVEAGQLIWSDGAKPLPEDLAHLRFGNIRHPYYWASFTLIGNPW